MNKKFLSAILFGALMVTSTGTFVSCKDYDDDIDRIDKELTDLKSQLAALQTKVDGGKYVTNVTKNGDGIVVTWNDNSTSTIETIKGDKGDAVEITIDPTTKNWLIDGEDTGVCAEGKDGAAGEATNGVSAKSPSIDPETGNWVVYAWDAEKQEYVGTDTGVSARGANAYVTEDSNYYILHVATSETGDEYTEVKLPKSPVVITEIETLGFLHTSAEKELIKDYLGNTKFTPVAYSTEGAKVKYNFSLVDELTQDQKDWNAEEVTKKLTKGQALSTISSGSANIVVRIAPATVDASALSFSLVNSQLAEAPIVLGTPVSYKGLLTETRAVSGNGLWTMKVSAKEGLVYDTEDQYEDQFSVVDEGNDDERRSMLFAFKEKDGFVTNYELAFVRDESMSLTAAPEDAGAYVGYESSIVFNSPSNVYDAHLHFEQADVIRWGIEYSGNGTAFTITKMNDELSVPTIPVEVHYVTLDGEVHKESVDIYVDKDNSYVELAGHNILINADADKNKFEESLDKMFDDLGDDNTTLWRHDVDAENVVWKIYRVKNATEANDIDVTNLYPGINVTFDKTGDELGKASKVIVSVGEEPVDRTRSYYARVLFYASEDQGNGRLLSVIDVPFTVSIPALTDLLVKEQVVFGGTANGTGVLNEYDWKDYENASYSLKYAFNKLEDAFAGNTQINFAIDADQKIKINDEDVVVKNNLATVTAADNASVYVTLKDYGKLKTPAYNTAINMVVTSASYLNRYEYTQEELNAAAFTLKIVSPIEQGTLTPAAGADATISVVATEEDGSAKVTESDLIAKTYAGVTYKIFENVFADGATTAEGWASPYINDVPVFESTNVNVFTMGEAQPATKDADGNVIPGYVIVKPMNVAYEDAVPVKVTVTDVWGYAKEATIKVKVSPKK